MRRIGLEVPAAWAVKRDDGNVSVPVPLDSAEDSAAHRLAGCPRALHDGTIGQSATYPFSIDAWHLGQRTVGSIMGFFCWRRWDPAIAVPVPRQRPLAVSRR